MTIIDHIETWIEQLLINTGVSAAMAPFLRLLIFLLILALVTWISFWITKIFINNYVYRIFRKTQVKWDDLLADKKVFSNVAHIIPAILVRLLAPTIFHDFENLLPFITKLTDAYVIVVGTMILVSLLKVGEYSLSSNQSFKDKPVSSYFQLARILLYIATAILILSVLMGKSPVYFLSAFGALSAIILLVFKDTILGLVASVQISSNDMVRVSDWVEMPKFDADGDVIAINLNTVKVQNWDKTITTIPTFYFITDSFKNWRGMVESGGRRIKRSIFINSHSIKFVDAVKRQEYVKYQLISDYINDRQTEIEKHNEKNKIDTSVLINGRRMTNIGVFRKYVESYLKSHASIRNNMIIMVRQLSIEDRGVPLEIYCFTTTTDWLEYETIQADIFDHILSSAKFFDLEIFQQPSGDDFKSAIQSISHP